MDTSGIRLPDVAREAGVSASTVSRVLGGRGRVAEATAERVRDAVLRLGYARSTLLPETSARLIAIAVPQEASGWQVEAACALTNAVAASGHIPVRGAVAGAAAIWLGFDAPEIPDGYPGPIVRLTSGTRGVPGGVIVAFGAGLHSALAHLAALGHRRIGLIRPAGVFGDACEAAFRAAHPSSAHLAPGDLSRWIAVAPDDETAGGRSMNRLLDSTCTVVVCGTDRQLFGALDGVRSLKLAAPRDVSLLGIGDDPRMQFTQPAATMVRVDPELLAGVLLDAALASIDGAPAAADGDTRAAPAEVPAELIVRASTGPARGSR